jgi:hypothetical protein
MIESIARCYELAESTFPSSASPMPRSQETENQFRERASNPGADVFLRGKNTWKLEHKARTNQAMEVFNSLPPEQRKPINKKFRSERLADRAQRYEDFVLDKMIGMGLVK